jgi:hypothetical protein
MKYEIQTCGAMHIVYRAVIKGSRTYRTQIAVTMTRKQAEALVASYSEV